MREIKFRAWDKARAKWIHESMYFAMEHQQPLASKIHIYAFNEVGMIGDPNVILMQYTGLKDKNGVEIYEGDIVRQVRPTTWAGEKNGSSRWQRVVEWKGTGFNLRTSQCEVIGNIMENPELLK